MVWIISKEFTRRGAHKRDSHNDFPWCVRASETKTRSRVIAIIIIICRCIADAIARHRFRKAFPRRGAIARLLFAIVSSGSLEKGSDDSTTPGETLGKKHRLAKIKSGRLTMTDTVGVVNDQWLRRMYSVVRLNWESSRGWNYLNCRECQKWCSMWAIVCVNCVMEILLMQAKDLYIDLSNVLCGNWFFYVVVFIRKIYETSSMR